MFSLLKDTPKKLRNNIGAGGIVWFLGFMEVLFFSLSGLRIFMFSDRYHKGGCMFTSGSWGGCSFFSQALFDFRLCSGKNEKVVSEAYPAEKLGDHIINRMAVKDNRTKSQKQRPYLPTTKP